MISVADMKNAKLCMRVMRNMRRRCITVRQHIKTALVLGLCLGMLAGCGRAQAEDTEMKGQDVQDSEEKFGEQDTQEEPGGQKTPENETAAADSTEDMNSTDTWNKAVPVTECPEELCVKVEGRDYGTVEHITYQSDTTGLERGANILLPAGYSDEQQYPVLYFLHGIFGDEYSLIKDGNNKIPEILGNLASEGLAKEMIVVFPNMYASSDPNQKPDFNSEAVLPYDNFINDLVNDLIPYIESNYSVLTDRENRAILGFSMGGRETLFIGISRPDLFGYIGAIAPAPGLTPGQDKFMTHVGQMQEEDVKITDTENMPNILMVCCGSRDSVVGKFPLSYHEIMEKNGVDHLWYEVPGADHDSNAIRSGLYNFVIRYVSQ